MKVYVAINYDSDIFGVYTEKSKMYEDINAQLKDEGVPEDEIDIYAEDWRVCGPFYVIT